jgi:hypothetical protein
LAAPAFFALPFAFLFAFGGAAIPPLAHHSPVESESSFGKSGPKGSSVPDWEPMTAGSPYTDDEARQKNNGDIFNSKRRVIFMVGLECSIDIL